MFKLVVKKRGCARHSWGYISRTFAIKIEADDVEILTATRANGLEIEVLKTDALLLTGRPRVEECTLDMKGCSCPTKPHVN